MLEVRAPGALGWFAEPCAPLADAGRMVGERLAAAAAELREDVLESGSEGRGVGETMAVLMATGHAVHIPHSVLDSVRTLTANIGLEMPYAMGDHRASLFVVGLLTLLLVTCMVVAGEWVGVRGRAAPP